MDRIVRIAATPHTILIAAIPRIVHIPRTAPGDSPKLMTQSITSRIQNGEIIARVDASLFPADVVLKTLYWFGDKFSLVVDAEGGFNSITLRPVASATINSEELDHYLQKLERDLVDFSLRATIRSRGARSHPRSAGGQGLLNRRVRRISAGRAHRPVGFQPAAVQL